MIRFVRIQGIDIDGNDINPKMFAWYNSVYDNFISFNGNFVWISWKDFEADWEDDWAELGMYNNIERFRQLYNNEWMGNADD